MPNIQTQAAIVVYQIAGGGCRVDHQAEHDEGEPRQRAGERTHLAGDETVSQPRVVVVPLQHRIGEAQRHGMNGFLSRRQSGRLDVAAPACSAMADPGSVSRRSQCRSCRAKRTKPVVRISP